MEKLKVYLDTSVISHLEHDDVPEKMADTKQLWTMFQDGKYRVFLSTVTLEEIGACPEPKKSLFLRYLGQIDYDLIQIDEDVVKVAERLINKGILTQKSYDDCQHIGAALVAGCDCIVSWNFKHIVNIKTIMGIRSIADIDGCKSIEILSPSALLESGD